MYGAAANCAPLICLLLLALCGPCMVWQLTQLTSTLRCLAIDQFSSWRWPPWHVRQTADFSAAVAVLEPTTFAGLFLIGSCRCSVASPWQLWHALPLASFEAP